MPRVFPEVEVRIARLMVTLTEIGFLPAAAAYVARRAGDGPVDLGGGVRICVDDG